MRRVSKVQRKTKVITYVEQQIWYVWLRKETEREGGRRERGEERGGQRTERGRAVGKRRKQSK